MEGVDEDGGDDEGWMVGWMDILSAWINLDQLESINGHDGSMELQVAQTRMG